MCRWNCREQPRWTIEAQGLRARHGPALAAPSLATPCWSCGSGRGGAAGQRRRGRPCRATAGTWASLRDQPGRRGRLRRDQIDEPLPDEVVDAGYAPTPSSSPTTRSPTTPPAAASRRWPSRLPRRGGPDQQRVHPVRPPGRCWPPSARRVNHGPSAGDAGPTATAPSPSGASPRRAVGSPGRTDGGDLDGGIYDRAVGPCRSSPRPGMTSVDASETTPDPNNIFGGLGRRHLPVQRRRRPDKARTAGPGRPPYNHTDSTSGGAGAGVGLRQRQLRLPPV
jgi:hypothetical protein